MHASQAAAAEVKVRNAKPRIDGHNHIMVELAMRRKRGERAVFSRRYAPAIRKGGVNVLVFHVGGDTPILTNGSDLRLWGTLWNIDMLRQEAEESADSLAICRNGREIRQAIASDKIAVLLGLEGGRPLEGQQHYHDLCILRTLHELGVRVIGLTNNGRNAIGDGLGETRTGGGLTNFGVSVVKEMNRLGMVIDLTHISDRGFSDVLALSESPVIDSHSNARALSNFLRNRSDEQIRALASHGGVIGVCPNCAMLGPSETPTVADLVNHVDHIVQLVGIEHVAIGSDHIDFDLCGIDMIWGPAPGWLEGLYYGERDKYFLDEFENVSQFPAFREALTERGYRDSDVDQIMGGNWFRVLDRVTR